MPFGDKRRERDSGPLPEEVRAQTEATDALLRGEGAPPGAEGLEDLIADLRHERPEPDPGYAAELDAWAAEGFERGRGPRSSTSPTAAGRTRGNTWFRRLAPAGALAATVLVAVIAISQNSGSDQAGSGTSSLDAKEAPSAAPESAGDAETGVQEYGGTQTAPATEAVGPAAAPDRAEPSRITLVVPVGEVAAVRAEALAIATAAGGREAPGQREVDSLTLAVPAEELDEVLDELRDLGSLAGVVRQKPPGGAPEATVEVLFENG